MVTKEPQEFEEIVSASGQDLLCLFRRDPDGGYFVTSDDLPPLIAWGATIEEARANVAAEIVTCIAARENFYDPFREMSARPRL